MHRAAPNRRPTLGLGTATIRTTVTGCCLALALVAAMAFAQGYALQPFSHAVPGNAVEAGAAADRSPLFVCVAASWGGEHPGSLTTDGVCHVPWGGQEHVFDRDFLVLVGGPSATGSWQRMAAGGVPKNAFAAGDDGADIAVCRVAVAGGLYPGKLTDDGWCYVAADGKEFTFSSDYEVLVE